MIKKLAKSIREYKKPTLLTLLFIIGEAVIESVIPFITARLVNQIKAGAGLSFILETGGILVGLAGVLRQRDNVNEIQVFYNVSLYNLNLALFNTL